MLLSIFLVIKFLPKATLGVKGSMGHWWSFGVKGNPCFLKLLSNETLSIRRASLKREDGIIWYRVSHLFKALRNNVRFMYSFETGARLSLSLSLSLSKRGKRQFWCLFSFYLIFGQRDVRKLVKSRWTKDVGNPYDMEDMVMPLHAFINDPIAHEIIHNGATFQVCCMPSIYLVNLNEQLLCIGLFSYKGFINNLWNWCFITFPIIRGFNGVKYTWTSTNIPDGVSVSHNKKL